jgi:hypothetical protein
MLSESIDALRSEIILTEAEADAADRLSDKYAAELVAWSRQAATLRAAIIDKRKHLDLMINSERIATEVVPIARAFRKLGMRTRSDYSLRAAHDGPALA